MHRTRIHNFMLKIVYHIIFFFHFSLLVQLARDLQTDFYRHFKDFFDLLVQLLSRYTQDSEILESTFVCLSYIFKFLWRYLVKDIRLVFG